MTIQIVTLSRDLAAERVDQLVSLGAGGSGWTKANFMHELPEKWRWSSIALNDTTQAMIGLLIASRYAPNQVHIHELVVLPSTRRLGVGRRLLEYLASCAEDTKEIATLSLKVATDNAPAIAFYNALGFQKDTEERGMFWMKRNCQSG